ncbi:MAG: hypothetical protein QXF76_02705 [Candidatus Anstonellales archaeon]
MKESELQSKSIKMLKNFGFLVIRISNPTQRGLPDILAISEKGDVIAIEFKIGKNNQSELQKYIQKEFEKRNLKYYLIRDLNELKAIFKLE